MNHAPAVTRTLATRLLFFEQGRLTVDAPIDSAFARLAERGQAAYVAPGTGASP